MNKYFRKTNLVENEEFDLELWIRDSEVPSINKRAYGVLHRLLVSAESFLKESGRTATTENALCVVNLILDNKIQEYNASIDPEEIVRAAEEAKKLDKIRREKELNLFQ
jgi:hypothetical protein